MIPGHHRAPVRIACYRIGPGLARTLMASQKVRPTALWRFFRISTYWMYAFAPEKPPSLVGRNFCLAMASQKVRQALQDEIFV